MREHWRHKMLEPTSYRQIKKDADGCFRDGCLAVLGLVIVLGLVFMFFNVVLS